MCLRFRSHFYFFLRALHPPIVFSWFAWKAYEFFRQHQISKAKGTSFNKTPTTA